MLVVQCHHPELDDWHFQQALVRCGGDLDALLNDIKIAESPEAWMESLEDYMSETVLLPRSCMLASAVHLSSCVVQVKSLEFKIETAAIRNQLLKDGATVVFSSDSSTTTSAESRLYLGKDFRVHYKKPVPHDQSGWLGLFESYVANKMENPKDAACFIFEEGAPAEGAPAEAEAGPQFELSMKQVAIQQNIRSDKKYELRYYIQGGRFPVARSTPIRWQTVEPDPTNPWQIYDPDLRDTMDGVEGQMIRFQFQRPNNAFVRSTKKSDKDEEAEAPGFFGRMKGFVVGAVVKTFTGELKERNGWIGLFKAAQEDAEESTPDTEESIPDANIPDARCHTIPNQGYDVFYRGLEWGKRQKVTEGTDYVHDYALGEFVEGEIKLPQGLRAGRYQLRYYRNQGQETSALKGSFLLESHAPHQELLAVCDIQLQSSAAVCARIDWWVPI